MELGKKKLTKLLLGVLFLIAGLLYSCNSVKKSGEDLLDLYQQQSDSGIVPAEEISAETTVIIPELIFVHVSGEVHNPGVYEVAAGSRGYELIKLAGGFTEEAAEDYLNLAKVVADGDKLVVPKRGEIASNQIFSGDFGSQVRLININTASETELMTLPGIGEAKAKAIIKYRENQGGFKAVEDIMKISGIKEAAFEKIKDLISV